MRCSAAEPDVCAPLRNWMSKARDVYKEIEFALLLVIERSVEFLGGGLKLWTPAAVMMG